MASRSYSQDSRQDVYADSLWLAHGDLLSLDQRLAQILNALPGAVILLDTRGVIRQVNRNASEILGQPLLGRTWSRIVNREFSSQETADGDLHLKSGAWMHLSRQSIDDGAGELLMLADVSNTRQTIELLQRQQRLSCMGEMTARLAHQIRTPLASALLYARQLRADSNYKEDPASRICERLEEIVHMIDDMLNFAGGARGSEASFSVRELLENVLAESIGTSGGQLSIAMAHDDLVVAGNRGAIKGAILNLVENAFQACGSAGRVELGAELIKDRVCLTVSDNGPGIPRDIQDRLFEPFFTTRPQGTGLGLAIVRAVAEAHAADVVIDSSSKGTSFALCLRADGGSE